MSSLAAKRAQLGEGFYQAYFQTSGVADAELSHDVRSTVRRFLYSASGDAPPVSEGRGLVIPEGRGILDIMAEPARLPDWLTEADIESYVETFAKTGFTGDPAGTRSIDLSWELMAPCQGARVSTPALYVAGERDVVVGFPGVRARIQHLSAFVPNLRRTILFLAAATGLSRSRQPRSIAR